MWTNPRYRELTGQDPPGRSQATAEAPKPSGELLATFPRKGPDGVQQELRVVLDEYQGHSYISVRLWQAGQDGAFWPLRGKGVSIRLGEAEGVAAALQQAIGQFEQPKHQGATGALQQAIGQFEQPKHQAPPGRRQRPEGRRDWDRDGSPPAPSKDHSDAY